MQPLRSRSHKAWAGRENRVPLRGKPFSSHDSSLLMGMVRTSKFVNEEQRARLCAKLEEIMSDRELEEMVESIFVDERETHEGMNALAAMAAASSAIRNNEQLCFRYRRHLMNGDELIDRQISSEDPVCLVYSFGHYYLETCVTTDEVPEGESFFRRLDHMTNAMVSGRSSATPAGLTSLGEGWPPTSESGLTCTATGPAGRFSSKSRGVAPNMPTTGSVTTWFFARLRGRCRQSPWLRLREDAAVSNPLPLAFRYGRRRFPCKAERPHLGQDLSGPFVMQRRYASAVRRRLRGGARGLYLHA